jgi:uncharacterized membrane protein YbaN (DUF454 family)
LSNKINEKEHGPFPSEHNLNNISDRFKKSFYVIAGTICVIIGAIGIFLPLLPTTPFMLLAAACYCRGSERMLKWLLNNKYFGSYIRNYREGKGMSAKSKTTAITTLWLTISLSILFIRIFIMQITLLIIATAVTIYLLRMPTLKRRQTNIEPKEASKHN